MKSYYSHRETEYIVQKYWKEKDTFKVKEIKGKEKYYCLSMLPYPSGKIHMGHVRNYTIGDVISRYQRMLGKNVLQPIGWDAFGLPAENAAIKNNVLPSMWTNKNIKYMKKQLQSLGFSYDWSREISTCDPNYYKWEQWFFIRLYEKGLVYKKYSLVNWCKTDKTVLANEQVINERCWRCNTKIKQKSMYQWFIKITDYADELLHDLDKLKNWPDTVKTMQRNWIGKSELLEVDFQIVNMKNKLTGYIDRPDLIMGITYITISMQHEFVSKISKKNLLVKEFIKNHNNTIILENKGIKIERVGINTGMHALHPLNGEHLPILVTNFKSIYDKDVSFGIPAHNKIDLEFALKHSLPIKQVIHTDNESKESFVKKQILKKGILFNSNKFNGLTSEIGANTIISALKKMGVGRKKIHYRLQDWCISRQRYWGVPIPMMTKKNGKIIPVPDKNLPVLLPRISIGDIAFGLRQSILQRKINCDNETFLLEKDTFDTFMESSWYYARYTCPNYNFGMLNKKSSDYWLPVNQYIGGIEHATMHLIYFRFYHKLLREIGLVSPVEPVDRLLCQGMVLSDSFYYISKSGEQIWISPNDVNLKRNKIGKIIQATDKNGKKLIYAGMQKMSKSKNNGIDPKKIIDKYGADTLRLFIMFSAPASMPIEWNESGIKGMNRFLKRIWCLVYKISKHNLIQNINKKSLNNSQKLFFYEMQKTIVKVTDDIDRKQTFNTAISAIMKFVKKIRKLELKTEQDFYIFRKSLVVVIKMLYPFAPHICFVLYKEINNGKEIDYSNWPKIDHLPLLKIDKLIIIVQVDGKFRGKILVDSNESKKSIECIAMKKIQFIERISKKFKKIIYIPGKLINFVTV